MCFWRSAIPQQLNLVSVPSQLTSLVFNVRPIGLCLAFGEVNTCPLPDSTSTWGELSHTGLTEWWTAKQHFLFFSFRFLASRWPYIQREWVNDVFASVSSSVFTFFYSFFSWVYLQLGELIKDLSRVMGRVQIKLGLGASDPPLRFELQGSQKKRF